MLDDTLGTPRYWVAGNPVTTGGLRTFTQGTSPRTTAAVATSATYRAMSTDDTGTNLYLSYFATSNVNTGLLRAGGTTWPTGSFTCAWRRGAARGAWWCRDGSGGTQVRRTRVLRRRTLAQP
jgi:hypothetical protein